MFAPSVLVFSSNAIIVRRLKTVVMIANLGERWPEVRPVVTLSSLTSTTSSCSFAYNEFNIMWCVVRLNVMAT